MQMPGEISLSRAMLVVKVCYQALTKKNRSSSTRFHSFDSSTQTNL